MPTFAQFTDLLDFLFSEALWSIYLQKRERNSNLQGTSIKASC